MREGQESGSSSLLYLPAYSPDLNPIEPMFAKIKAFLKKAVALTRSALSHPTTEALDAVTYRDIQGFFTLLGSPDNDYENAH